MHPILQSDYIQLNFEAWFPIDMCTLNIPCSKDSQIEVLLPAKGMGTLTGLGVSTLRESILTWMAWNAITCKYQHKDMFDRTFKTVTFHKVRYRHLKSTT